MPEIIIQQIRLDPNRRLRIRPTPSRPSGYDYIWRDASSVRWDDLGRELYMLEVPEFTPLEEFTQIVSAVAREYGDKLILSPSTIYVDIPSDMVAALRESGRP